MQPEFHACHYSINQFCSVKMFLTLFPCLNNEISDHPTFMCVKTITKTTTLSRIITITEVMVSKQVLYIHN